MTFLSINSKTVVLNKKTWYITCLEYLLLIGIIFSTNSIYWVSTSNRYKIVILSIIYISVGILSLLSFWNLSTQGRFPRKTFLLFLSYYGVMIPFIFYNKSISSVSLLEIIRLTILPLTLSFIFLERIQNDKLTSFMNKFVNIAFFLSLLSLLLWGLSSLGKTPTGMTTIDWGSIKQVPSLFNLQFFPQSRVTFLGFFVLRNTGMFAEAPMYSFVLSMALIIHLFLNKNTKITDGKSIILILTLLSTTSTTGLLTIIMSIFLIAFSRSSKYMKVFLTLLVPVLLIILNLIIKSKTQNMSGSVSLRIDDIQAGIQAWKLHPFIGNGFENTLALNSFMDPSRFGMWGNSGFSSGILSMLARGGLLLTSIFAFLPYIIYGKKGMKELIFASIVCVTFCVTIVDRTNIYMFIIMFMYMVGFFQEKNKIIA